MRYYAAACQTDFPCPATRTEIGERALSQENIERRIADAKKKLDK
jgi:hypothetical protein